MKTLSAFNDTAIDNPHVSSIGLFKLELSGLTLYLCDRVWGTGADTCVFNSQLYEPVVISWSTNSGDIKSANYKTTPGNASLIVDNNTPIGGAATFSVLLDSYDFYYATLTFSQIFEGASAAGDKIDKFKGSVENILDLLSKQITLVCTGYELDVAHKFSYGIVNSDDYPNADPVDIGKMLPQAYGQVSKVPFIAADAGAVTTLVADITDSTTTLILTDSSRFDASGTVKIESEEIDYTGNSSNQLTGCSRGANSTSPVAHLQSSNIAQVQSEYNYIIGHPVKAIDDVYLGDDRLLSDWYKAYTGQTGDQHATYGSKACVSFPGVEDDGTFYPATSGDDGDWVPSVAINTSQNALSFGGANQKRRYIRFANVTIPQGSTIVAAYLRYTCYVSIGGAYEKEYLYFNDHDNAVAPTTFGEAEALSKTTAVVGWQTGDWTDGTQYNTPELKTVLQEIVNREGWSSGNAMMVLGWPNDGGGNTGAQVSSYDYNSAAEKAELHVTWTFSPINIGDSVSADIQGFQDDGSGTYTGTPNALIERPDHIMKHFLIDRCGVASGDINSSSYSAAGSFYGNDYNLGIVIIDPPNTRILIHDIANQVKSLEFWEAGKHHLLHVPSGAIPVDSQIYEHSIDLDTISLRHTSRVDLLNTLSAVYNVDWLAEEYQGTVTAVDSTSVTAYGTLEGDQLKFSYIITEAHAQVILDWKKSLWCNPRFICEFVGGFSLDHIERGDVVQFGIVADGYLDKAMGGLVTSTMKFRILNVKYEVTKRLITAVELP